MRRLGSALAVLVFALTALAAPAVASTPSCSTVSLGTLTVNGGNALFYVFPGSCVWDAASVARFFPTGIASMTQDQAYSADCGGVQCSAGTAADWLDASGGPVPGWPLDPATNGWTLALNPLPAAGAVVSNLRYNDYGPVDAQGVYGPLSASGGVTAPGYVSAAVAYLTGGGSSAADPVTAVLAAQTTSITDEWATILGYALAVAAACYGLWRGWRFLRSVAL